ncbi:hypothetical protein EGW08_021463, partial [Elysia chlorotica]
ISTFVFFVVPMVVITIMYLMIGMRLRNTALASDIMSQTQSKTVATRARRAVIRMLVAVVVAFFVCWAPFHAQRLMTVYIKQDQWTPELLALQSHLFYVSGVLYFLSCTINPILYNLLSRKFRQAFKRTLCRCCLGLDVYSIPVLYRLKAKFVEGDGDAGGNHFNPHGCRASSRRYKAHPSTKETTCVGRDSSSSGAHAHSDGRLHRICRHKYCPTGSPAFGA